MKRIIPAMLAIMLLSLPGLTPTAWAQDFSATLLGYRVHVGPGGLVSSQWSNGTLGETWDEGDWVPYQLILNNVQSAYPNLNGLTEIKISFDFTRNGARYIDLVRGIQIGLVPLNNQQGWPADDGTSLPLTSIQAADDAESDFGNTPPLENQWLGFELLNLPNSRVMRSLINTDGSPTEARRKLVVTKNDLLSHGISYNSNTIVLYFQIHESRTIVWSNAKQAAYDATPADLWGGYLYGDPPFSTDSRNGSSYVTIGGRVKLENICGDCQTIPIPIPRRPGGQIFGAKWLDANTNSLRETGEATLSGWGIQLRGVMEGDSIDFPLVLTDPDGAYSFSGLPLGLWIVRETKDRVDPHQTGYSQSYPNGTFGSFGIASAVSVTGSGLAPYGWSVPIKSNPASQGGLDFGNSLCAEVTASAITSLELCPGSRAEFCTTVTGDPPLTFSWTKDGVVIGGANSNCLVINSCCDADEGEYCVTVTGACGDPVTRCATLEIGECEEEYLTLCPCFYVDPNRVFNGLTTHEIIDLCITPSNPLVLGKPGRSVTFGEGTEECIVSRLPVSGNAESLPSNLGNANVNPVTCQTSPQIPMIGGKYRSGLLGQAIVIALNMRFDPDLANAGICRVMVTQAALPGPDGLYNTDDDLLDPGHDGVLGTDDDPLITVTLPASVLTALGNLSLPQTVSGLLELANRGLAGQSTGGANLSNIKLALGGINNAFDGGRFLIECGASAKTAGDISQEQGGDSRLCAGRVPIAFRMSSNSPNPVVDATSISLDLPERSLVRVTIYDITGRKVATLHDGQMDAGYQSLTWVLPEGSEIPNGIYMCKADVTGLETGQRAVQGRKLLIAR
jgi:hypothetical protein